MPPFEASIRAARRFARRLKGSVLLKGVVMHGPKRPEVALTFDDGPGPEHTPAILDALAARKARATFFLLGKHVEAHPELARRVAEEHALGVHSFDHARSCVRSIDDFERDLALCRAVFTREIGKFPSFYRFPWGDPGAISPRDVYARHGLRCVHWSGSGAESLEPKAIAASLEGAIEPGAILLLHDGLAPGSVYPKPRDATVLALPMILDAIEAHGLSLVTLDEMLDPTR